MIAVCLIWFSFLVWTPLHGFPLGGVPKSAAGFHSFSSNAAPQEQSMPDMAAYSRGFQTVFTEQPCHRIDATIPSDLQPGTYYRCGPSMFSAGSILPPKTFLIQPKAPVVPDGSDRDRMVLHPWEGDGGILAISILENNQQIVTRFRYVRTNAFTNERKQGLRLYTGMDATRRMAKQDLIQPAWKHHLQPGLNKMRKNTSHTRAVHWGQRLLSLWEGGLPYKLDAVALDTEGRSQLGGVLKETDSLGGSAVYDANSNRMLFTTNQQDVTTSKLTIYEFNDKFRLQQKHEAELKGFALLSDFAVTKNYILVVQPPVSVNAMQFLFNKEPGKVLQLQTGASTLLLIPRDGSPQKSMVLPFEGITERDLQIINAFENEDGSIVFDAIRMDDRSMNDKPITQYPWAKTLEDFQSTTAKRDLVRYMISQQGSVTKTVLLDTQCYFGVVNPAYSAKRHCYLYMAVGALGATVAPPQGIAKLDCTSGQLVTWMPAEYEFCGEPMFAPSIQATAEDDGYLITILYNGKSQESEMIILSAKDLSLQTRVPLGMAIPHGLHGCYCPGVVFTADEIERRAKLADKMESRGNRWNEVKSDFSGLGLRLDDLEEYFGDMM